MFGGECLKRAFWKGISRNSGSLKDVGSFSEAEGLQRAAPMSSQPEGAP